MRPFTIFFTLFRSIWGCFEKELFSAGSEVDKPPRRARGWPDIFCRKNFANQAIGGAGRTLMPRKDALKSYGALSFELVLELWKVVQNWIARDLLFWQISQISLAFSFFSFCTAHQLQKAKARLITRCSLWRKNGNHLGLPLLEFSTFLNTCSRVGQIKGVPKPLLKGGKRELLCSRSSEKKKNESSAWHEKGRVAFEASPSLSPTLDSWNSIPHLFHFL